MLHHIQKSILDRLATAEYLRYGEIKPCELDGNVFGYHLKSLISGGYINKCNNGAYTLTTKGNDYIVRRYEDSSTAAHVIFLVVVRSPAGYLLRRRLVQPLLGRIGFVHGEPLAGEDLETAARARLRTKTGIDTSLRVVGSALITQYVDDELASYSHAIILTGETEQYEIIKIDATGENFWSNTFEIDNILPSCEDITDMINADETWRAREYYL